MRTTTLSLLLVATIGALATPAAADPLGPVSGEIELDTTNLAPCAGPWTTSYSVNVGPLTITIVTCDPFVGNPPW